MGLDMYLYAEDDISVYGEKGEDKIKGLDAVSPDLMSCRVGGPVEVKVQVGYWRKVNHIHKWFVDNVQEGEDNCEEFYVSIENLEELKKVCEEALKSREAEELPPQTGFFFGGTDIDEHYWSETQRTVEVLEKVLSMKESYDFYYRSSW